MNIWYVSSLIIIGLGMVILVGCFLGSIFAIKKIVTVLNGNVQRIQQQIQPVQNQVNILNTTINRLTLEVNQKKSEVVKVTDSGKALVRNIIQLLGTSRLSAKQLVDKVNNDPQMQVQTKQWTNTVMDYLKRK